VDIEIQLLNLDDLSGDLADALAYWRELASPRPMPSWPEFDLLRLPMALVGTTHVVDVIDGQDDFKIRFWGTGFVNIHAQEATNLWVSEIQPPELGEVARKSIQAVVGGKAPLALTILLNPHGETEAFQTVLRLPLSHADDRVEHVVTVSTFPQGRNKSRLEFDRFRR